MKKQMEHEKYLVKMVSEGILILPHKKTAPTRNPVTFKPRFVKGPNQPIPDALLLRRQDTCADGSPHGTKPSRCHIHIQALPNWL